MKRYLNSILGCFLYPDLQTLSICQGNSTLHSILCSELRPPDNKLVLFNCFSWVPHKGMGIGNAIEAGWTRLLNKLQE